MVMHFQVCKDLLLPPANEVSERYCFITGVCLSARGGGIPPLKADPPLEADPPRTTKADGTHPTGMLSCYDNILKFQVFCGAQSTT